MERDCESELSKLNIEQNACIYHFGASVIHGQRSNILRLLKESFGFLIFYVFFNFGYGSEIGNFAEVYPHFLSLLFFNHMVISQGYRAV